MSSLMSSPSKMGKIIEPAPVAPSSDMLTSDARTLHCLPLRVESGVKVLFAVL